MSVSCKQSIYTVYNILFHNDLKDRIQLCFSSFQIISNDWFTFYVVYFYVNAGVNQLNIFIDQKQPRRW